MLTQETCIGNFRGIEPLNCWAWFLSPDRLRWLMAKVYILLQSKISSPHLLILRREGVAKSI